MVEIFVQRDVRLKSQEEKILDDLQEVFADVSREVLMREDLFHKGNFEISLTFVDKDVIKNINMEYREKDNVTDVLSFPQFFGIDEIKQLEKQEQNILLGDVIICFEIAKKQAEAYEHSIEREIVYLFVHSLLHLLGYDHMIEEDKEKMRYQEEIYMKYLGMER